MKIITITGVPQAGKDKFVEYAKESDYPVYNFSTVDFIKEKALSLGWDGNKDDKGRRFLSDLKDALSLYNDAPFQNVLYKIKSIPQDDAIVFVHTREPEDIKRWKEETNSISLLVRRAVAEDNIYNNHADSKVFDYDYDYVYRNDGELKQLKIDAISFTNWIGGKNWESMV